MMVHWIPWEAHLSGVTRWWRHWIWECGNAHMTIGLRIDYYYFLDFVLDTFLWCPHWWAPVDRLLFVTEWFAVTLNTYISYILVVLMFLNIRLGLSSLFVDLALLLYIFKNWNVEPKFCLYCFGVFFSPKKSKHLTYFCQKKDIFLFTKVIISVLMLLISKLTLWEEKGNWPVEVNVLSVCEITMWS